jgi:hypothetical protein
MLFAGGQPHALTLDFDAERFEQLSGAIPALFAEVIRGVLADNPTRLLDFKFSTPITLMIRARFGDEQTNDQESYLPLQVVSVVTVHGPRVTAVEQRARCSSFEPDLPARVTGATAEGGGSDRTAPISGWTRAWWGSARANGTRRSRRCDTTRRPRQSSTANATRPAEMTRTSSHRLLQTASPWYPALAEPARIA